MSAPTGKWEKARRQFFGHRSFYPFDPEGQGDGARHQEKRNRLCLPRQANGKKRGGSSSATANALVCEELAQEQLLSRDKAMELDINLSTDTLPNQY